MKSPGSSGVGILPSNARGRGLIFGQGAKILRALWPKKKQTPNSTVTNSIKKWSTKNKCMLHIIHTTSKKSQLDEVSIPNTTFLIDVRNSE